MANSYVNYVGDGTTTQFSLTFPYIDQDDVHLYVDGVEKTYTWVSESIIDADVAPAASTNVLVRRETPITSALVDFSDGSMLTEEDLDNANRQVFYATQEAVESLELVLAVTELNVFDALSKRITNVANPVDGTDAMNLQSVQQYFDADIATVLSYKNAAAASAAAAATSASNAATSASNAASSASAAATSASNAASSASASAASAAAAAASETAAGLSETAAGLSETAAAASEALAEKWSSEAEDVIVEAGKYSAYHWAQKAYDVVTDRDGVILTDPTMSMTQTVTAYQAADTTLTLAGGDKSLQMDGYLNAGAEEYWVSPNSGGSFGASGFIGARAEGAGYVNLNHATSSAAIHLLEGLRDAPACRIDAKPATGTPDILRLASGGVTKVTVENDGNLSGTSADFSGTIEITGALTGIWNGGTISRNHATGGGVQFSTAGGSKGSVLPAAITTATNNETDLGGSSNKWADGHFGGTVKAAGLEAYTNGTAWTRAYGNRAYLLVQGTEGGTGLTSNMWWDSGSWRAINTASQAPCHIDTSSSSITLSVASSSSVTAGDALTLRSNVSVYSSGVTLRYSGNNKLSTTSTGVTVTGTVNETSDVRLKKNRRPVNYGLSQVQALLPEKFDFTAEDQENDVVGFMAQNLEEVIPEAVHLEDEPLPEYESLYYEESTDEKGLVTRQRKPDVAIDPEHKIKTISTTPIIAVLVNAVKELSAQNTALEQRIAALEAARNPNN